MSKSRINLTLDADLLEFVKEYAESQRTTVSEVFTQFVLELKRVKENDPQTSFWPTLIFQFPS